MNEVSQTKHETKPSTNGNTAKASAAKPERKKSERRQRTGAEIATAKVLNLVGRLSPGDQRKVMAAVGVLVSKAED